jgi:hypothetical protein
MTFRTARVGPVPLLGGFAQSFFINKAGSIMATCNAGDRVVRGTSREIARSEFRSLFAVAFQYAPVFYF